MPTPAWERVKTTRWSGSLNERRALSESVPPCQQSQALHHIAALTLTPIHAEMTHRWPQTQPFPRYVGPLFEEATLCNKTATYSEDVAAISVRITGFSPQLSLVSLTGSDVAILTVEMFCPFSASASLRPLTHVRRPPGSTSRRGIMRQQGGGLPIKGRHTPKLSNATKLLHSASDEEEGDKIFRLIICCDFHSLSTT